MLIEAARRVEAAAKETLALVYEGSASCDELRTTLAVLKSAAGVVSAAQTAAAGSVAGRERHGDGGAEVLAAGAGLSRHEARSQVKTAEALREVPAVREAVESGRVSQANAKRLAEAIDKTSAEVVSGDGDLLAKAESMSPEHFAKEARRWAVSRDGDGGESEHARQRARRSVRLWNTDDGMVHLHGEFDAATGQRIGNRLRAEAGRMHDADKKNAGSGSERRSFNQCMADALDNLTANNTSGRTGSRKAFADICVIAHLNHETGRLVAETPDGDRLPEAVLEELACNAKLTGLLYDRDGKPIWRAHSVRTATDAQRQILLARYGGCFHCAAHPALCQIHHIKPVSQGGATKISNMVPVCWDCHQKIHHHNWQIRTTNGVHTLHPPGQAHHGPARAPDQPLLHLPGIAADPPEPPRLPAIATAEPEPLDLGQRDTAEAPSLLTPQATRPEPPTPETRGARAGPAAARATLRIARAGRDQIGTITDDRDLVEAVGGEVESLQRPAEGGGSCTTASPPPS